MDPRVQLKFRSRSQFKYPNNVKLKSKFNKYSKYSKFLDNQTDQGDFHQKTDDFHESDESREKFEIDDTESGVYRNEFKKIFNAIL